MYCDLWLQYIQVRKLFKGGNYSRAETIRGNTVLSYFKVDLMLMGTSFLAPMNHKVEQAWKQGGILFYGLKTSS